MWTNTKKYNKKNYSKFWWKPSQIKDRSERNKARRKMEKEWKAKKYDGKDVHHVKGLSWWNGKSNLRVISRKKNRQLWAKASLRAKKRKK